MSQLVDFFETGPRASSLDHGLFVPVNPFGIELDLSFSTSAVTALMTVPNCRPRTFAISSKVFPCSAVAVFPGLARFLFWLRGGASALTISLERSQDFLTIHVCFPLADAGDLKQIVDRRRMVLQISSSDVSCNTT